MQSLPATGKTSMAATFGVLDIAMHSFLFQMDGLGWLLAVSGSDGFLYTGNTSAMDSESIVPWDGREIKLDKLKEGLKN